MYIKIKNIYIKVQLLLFNNLIIIFNKEVCKNLKNDTKLNLLYMIFMQAMGKLAVQYICIMKIVEDIILWEFIWEVII